MPTSPRHGHTRQLCTAIAVADPVLLRLQHGGCRTVLLADSVTYDRANLMLLHHVRWCQKNRGFSGVFSPMREPANAFFEEVRIRNLGRAYAITVPSHNIMHTAGPIRSIPMAHLTADQYRTLRTASPRRLHTAAETFLPVSRKPRRASLVKTLRTLKNILTLQPARAGI
jgi:hypothetical protein